MERRQRGGENAFPFVEKVIGELRSREEALDSGARRARDSIRTAPRPRMQQARRNYGSRNIGTWNSAPGQAMMVRCEAEG
jgi:hypothetical protein